MYELTKQNISKITYKFFVSKFLDKEQVKVAQVGENEFTVKCGQVLTDQQIKGAILKYLIKQNGQAYLKS